ncbi:hypothetical protein Hanom_Chr13g01208231 [Helianthus anomalus]
MSAIKVQRTRQHCHGSYPKLVSEANVGKRGQQRPDLFVAVCEVLRGYKRS